MNTIEKIKSDIDFKRYLEVHEGHTFRGSKTLCPFHDDRNPSMDVEFKDNCWVFYCHACKAGGDIISYLKKKHTKQTREIIRDLQEEFGIYAPRPEKEVFEYI